MNSRLRKLGAWASRGAVVAAAVGSTVACSDEEPQYCYGLYIKVVIAASLVPDFILAVDGPCKFDHCSYSDAGVCNGATVVTTGAGTCTIFLALPDGTILTREVDAIEGGDCDEHHSATVQFDDPNAGGAGGGG